MADEYVFSPIMGKESVVLKQDQKNGSLYFTTDTRKIYFDVDDKSKIPIGSNVGLFYGQMKLTSEPVDGQTEFDFNVINDIIGNDVVGANILIPNVNDLILNSDGCFYKVLRIISGATPEDTKLECEKLTIAGSSSSGPSTGSGNASFKMSSLFYDDASISSTIALIQGSDCDLSFCIRSTDEDGELLLGEIGTYEVRVNEVLKTSGVVKGANIADLKNVNIADLSDDEKTTIKVGPYLSLGTNYVKITSRNSEGISSTKQVTIQITTLSLEWKYDQRTVNYWTDTNKTLLLEWTMSGASTDKQAFIAINDQDDKDHLIEVPINETTYLLDFAARGLKHGAHKVKMWVGAYVGGKYVESLPVYKNIIIAQDGKTSPIISCCYFDNHVNQYDTIKIPILIYDPENSKNTATFLEDSKYYGEEKEVSSLTYFDWNYTPTTGGTKSLMIQYQNEKHTFFLTVKDLGIKVEEIDGYKFKFKATEFSGNSAVQSWKSNGVQATFSDNFDWINGGLQAEEIDGQVRQFVRVPAGSTMLIDYPIFKTNAKKGKLLKIIFKATNCRDYFANVISCKNDKKIIAIDPEYKYFYDVEEGIMVEHSSNVRLIDNETIELINPASDALDTTTENGQTKFNKHYIKINDIIYYCEINMAEIEGKKYYYAQWHDISIEDGFEGLLLKAQSATFNSLSNTISTQYCEDTYIEFELEITSNPSYIKVWIDGIPAGYVSYNSDDSFWNNLPSEEEDTRKLLIGSNDCDVDIYLIKLYEDKDFTISDHMKNFIADAPNANEKSARYHRNDIMDDENNNDSIYQPISYTKLAKKNPNCLVHVYEIPNMTTTKKTIVEHCNYWQYHNSEKAVLTAQDVAIKVQGTSSEAYVLAAANLDSDFNYVSQTNNPSGFKDANENLLEDGWSMDGGNAIPCKFFCTKVNVASAENANNALNQQWYNMFQPYKSILRCKNPKARDTMQFTNGVIFIKDNNQKFDTVNPQNYLYNNLFGEVPGYLGEGNSYPRMYSLGQMGNSKDNTHVFHDIDNSNECCIEVRDNQSLQQRMMTTVNLEDIDGGKKYFEFRYVPKGREDEFARKWKEFVDWMAQSNPQPMYKEHVANSLAEYTTFATDPITKNKIITYVMNEDQTDYIEVEYSEDIKIYYTETSNAFGYTNLKLPAPPEENPDQYKYGNYCFRGYIADEKIQAKYTPLIKDFVVRNYNYANFATRTADGTAMIVDPNNHIVSDPNIGFTHDTYEYRMAKMLHECEDHLVMDSILYHYLFIERHCMIDNVAKNTFWSTEDGGKTWNLIKDYDNDTADGNDNNGKLTRTYGLECLDRLNSHSYVFNAHESVWFNFIHGLHEALSHMYLKLSEVSVPYNGKNVNIWSANDYLNAFSEWQSIVPERCWIEDYQRKYFRPYELYGNNFFNGMLEGGQKKYQRKQFEIYQETYMKSKYDQNADNRIFMRPTGKISLDHRLPVKAYHDCYVKIDTGQNVTKERVKKGEIVNIKPPIENLSNATFSLTPASAISDIGSSEDKQGQLNDYNPEAADLSLASKLRNLVFSTGDRASNTGFVSGLTFGRNNKLLETLYVGNLTNYTSDLNLEGCSSLLYLNAINSSFTGIKLADGAPTTTIMLENPTSLNLSNLAYLTDLTINNANRLSILKLNNIDTKAPHSQNILKQIFDNYSTEFTAYQLQNVQWKIDEASELDEQTKTINILDKLMMRVPVEDEITKERIPLAQALTGVLTIASSAYNKNDAIEFYEKYVATSGYTNFDIVFEGETAKIPLITICTGDGKALWKRRIKKGESVDAEFLSGGPNGAFDISKIYKTDNNKYTYKYTKEWIVKNSSGTQVAVFTLADETSLPTTEIEVTDDLYFYPQFEEIEQSYTVVFKQKNLDGTEKVIHTVENLRYETLIKDILPNEIPYQTIQNDISNTFGYDFKGYGNSSVAETPLEDNAIVSGNMQLYAIFEAVNDISGRAHPEWFNITRIEGQTVRYAISPKYTLGGKITLPATDNDGNPIEIIQAFGEKGKNITHIFLQDNNSIWSIESSAFSGYNNLKYFDFVKATNLMHINNEAFKLCTSLKSTDFSKTQLKTVGELAFNQSFVAEDLTFYLPATLTDIGYRGFSYLCQKNGIYKTPQLEIGTALNPTPLLFMKDDSGKFIVPTNEPFIQNTSGKFSRITFYYISNEQVNTEVKAYFGQDALDLSNITVDQLSGNGG